MTLLTWSNDYLIGDETIDAEHKELFRIINNFHDKWQERKESEDREAIATVLNRLVRYAEEHFQHEELIMRGADFPLIAEHRSIHEGLFERIFQIPGLGREFVNSAFNRDYTMVVGTVVLYAGAIVVFNLAVDVVQVWLNPRLRFDN